MASLIRFVITILFLMVGYTQPSLGTDLNFRESESYKIAVNIMFGIHYGVVNIPENEIDPILAQQRDCLVKHQDTIGINTCLDSALQAYDKVMNEIYQQALAENDDVTKKSLRVSQEKWISFRDAERRSQSDYAKMNKGTVIGVVVNYQNITAIRERIAELMFYLGADQG